MNEHSAPPGSDERDMRAALQHAVALVCVKEEMLDESSHMSTQAVAALSELVYQYATTCLSNDLLSFSIHANRRTITVEDVLLVARKDPQGLLAKLEAFVEQEKLSSRKENKSTAAAATTTRPESSSKKKKKKHKNDDAQLTQRMKELQQRLKKGIDSCDESDSDSSDVEMLEDRRKQPSSTPLPISVGKENQKQAATKAASDAEDPFASSSEDEDTRKKPVAVAEFPPGGTKSGFSSDSSSDGNMFDD